MILVHFLLGIIIGAIIGNVWLVIEEGRDD